MTRCTTPSSRRRTTFSQDGDYLYRDVKYTCGALGSHDPRCPTGRQNLQLAVDLTSAALPDARAVGEGVRVVGGRVLSRVAPKAAEAVESAADAARGLCSFTAATPVLMADGTTKPISQIHQGDRVLATDPHTGKHYARTVTRVWIHTDTFIHLNIDCQSLTVTEDHPIWDATDHTWERADQVHIGDLVTIADGRAAHVTGLDVRRTPAAPACNLTVDQTHTYHVGALAVLVHNTCGAGESVPPEVNWNQQEKRFAGKSQPYSWSQRAYRRSTQACCAPRLRPTAELDRSRNAWLPRADRLRRGNRNVCGPRHRHTQHDVARNRALRTAGCSFRPVSPIGWLFMSGDDLRVHVLLSMQRALLDNVTPALRGVAVSWTENTVTARFIYDSSEVDDEYPEIVAEVETLVLADLSDAVRTEFLALPLPASEPRTLRSLEVWAYLRRET